MTKGSRVRGYYVLGDALFDLTDKPLRYRESAIQSLGGGKTDLKKMIASIAIGVSVAVYAVVTQLSAS